MINSNTIGLHKETHSCLINPLYLSSECHHHELCIIAIYNKYIIPFPSLRGTSANNDIRQKYVPKHYGMLVAFYLFLGLLQLHGSRRNNRLAESRLKAQLVFIWYFDGFSVIWLFVQKLSSKVFQQLSGD
ncbi:hypothetical protein XENTR_v10019690 [Xenopus tropicalis]|nr:hypothetical protein XENTR_v10019690 [Xenopus tropicalis]